MYHLSAILASDDLDFCRTLLSLIETEAIPVKLAAQVFSTQDLFQKASLYLPDLVICDWNFSLPESPPKVFWTRLTESCHCKIVFVSDKRDYDQLYQIVRFHAANFILLPMTSEEIISILNETTERIINQKSFLLAENNAASRYLFMKRDINLLNAVPKTLEQINREYGIHFSPGLYRAFIIKLDCSVDIMSVFENDVLRDKIILIIKKNLTEYCYDILYDKLADGVMTLFNYSPIHHNAIQSECHNIFDEVKQAFQTFRGVAITMCISREYSDYLKIPEAKAEALDMRWARKHVGTNKVITTESVPEPNDQTIQTQEHLLKLKNQVLHAFQILDLKKSHTSMVQLFTYLKQSSDVISNRDARLIVRSMIDNLFEMHYNVLTSYGNIEDMRHEFIYRINMAPSMERLQRDFIKSAEEIITIVSKALEQHYSKPVLTAINHIKSNIRKSVSLSEVADLVGLTAPYFSSIFKKETGQTFSHYTASYRLDIAKQMLTDSNANISEIANSLGYSDAKYFDKMFKRREQITPSEYRRISQAKGKENQKN